jgi:hypothetical protein
MNTDLLWSIMFKNTMNNLKKDIPNQIEKYKRWGNNEEEVFRFMGRILRVKSEIDLIMVNAGHYPYVKGRDDE